MEITDSVQSGVAVIKISGSLDGNTVNEAQEKMSPLLSSGAKSLVLDLKDCVYVSSAGLRLLLMAAKQLSAKKGLFALSGLSDEIKDVMEMTGFNNFFKMFDTVDAALVAVQKGA